MALRPCLESRCPVLVDSSRRRCPAHERQRDRFRGTNTERGYDGAWTKLRNWFMSRPENQLCAECWKSGVVTPAEDCDHIEAFVGLDDPRRLDSRNLQPLCRAHHNAKTHGREAR